MQYRHFSVRTKICPSEMAGEDVALQFVLRHQLEPGARFHHAGHIDLAVGQNRGGAVGSRSHSLRTPDHFSTAGRPQVLSPAHVRRRGHL